VKKPPANGDVPRDLSPRSSTLWTTLHAQYDFEPHTDELLERALRYFDLADTLLTNAHEVGLTTPAGRGALSGSRDASMARLKLFQATGLDKADAGEPRRPGRPSDQAWSKMRQPRDPLTGRPLRGGAA
jgi:hypothetical protein